MSKLLLLLAIGVLVIRHFTGRWPWEPGPQARAEAAARRLLGLGQGAGREEILVAHRQLIAHVHPDKGGTSDLVNEANAARDVLLARLARR